MDSRDVMNALRLGFGDTVKAEARRPGLIQVTAPAFLSDGDPAFIFVRSGQNGQVIVSDLGRTLMRLSYSMKITGKVTEALGRLATARGFSLEDGEIRVGLPLEDILGGALGLIQVESEAEASIQAAIARRASADGFKRMVRDVLKETFRERCSFDVPFAKADPKNLFPVDVAINGPIWVGIELVPNNEDAERAVATKLIVDPHVEGRKRWIAIPRDAEALRSSTRRRLMEHLFVPIPQVTEKNIEHMTEQLRDLTG